MTKQRLDQLMVQKGLVSSRSQAESWIRLGKVTIDGRKADKQGLFVSENADVRLTTNESYVSRAGLKLASVAQLLKVDFRSKIVLDVGSSTGGFTDYALQHGAKKVIAVDVGSHQLHPSLRKDKRIELHEKTDIRDCYLRGSDEGKRVAQAADLLLARSDEKNRQVCLISEAPHIVVIDVSFISLREILPSVARIAPNAQIVAMVKPQFEAGREQVNKGIIKNDAIRRQILRDFETWSKSLFVIQAKRDSEVAGSKGNRERFYLLQTT
ncbi:MAG: TlyA family RNA methyltransferase [Candidatus Saccharimonadales bacterium]